MSRAAVKPSRRPTTSSAEVEALEAERDFLLQSLDDLDTERAAGNVDDETFATLHDDYTARAAAVVRALRDGVDSRPAAPPMSMRRRLLALGGVLAFAALAAVALAAAMGVRLPGQEVTGSINQTNAATAAAQQQAKLAKAAAAKPQDAAAQLALARNLFAAQQYVRALDAYNKAAQLDPNDAESRAYMGWILYLANIPDQAKPRLAEAEKLNEAYPDTHFFQGMVLMNTDHDFSHAVLEFQRYLALAPAGALAGQAQRALGAALSAASPTATTVAPPTTTAH
ncbi:MAG: cytochrome c biosis factor [Actinomycetia bacterium]|nr:cytochrome c biosis factor [Actinomycetes bacterium]